MELKNGSIVIIGEIIKDAQTSSSVYENISKKVGKIGVVKDSFLGVNRKILYRVTFSNEVVGDSFYEEELEVIGFDNSHSTNCYVCGRFLKNYKFKEDCFKYCPKCLA